MTQMTTEEKAKVEAEDSSLNPAAGTRKLKHSQTMTTFNLDRRFNDKKVMTRLWRTIIDIVRAGQVPGRTAALAMIANNDFEAPIILPGGAPTPGPPTLAATASGAVSSSTIGGKSMGGNSALAANAAASAAAAALLGGPVVIELRQWDSFSGKDLDCGTDAGPVTAFVKQLPSKLQGASTMANSVVAVLVVSSAVFKQAMAMQQDIAVRDAVDTCCRLPFLRHTPLGELYKLSKHLETVRFAKGETILRQGKDNTQVFLLVEGEVELVVDIPLTADK